MRIPTKYAAWAELALIQLLVPNASFLGHLCGIAAGLIYIFVQRCADSRLCLGCSEYPHLC